MTKSPQSQTPTDSADDEAAVLAALDSGDDDRLWKRVLNHPREDELYRMISEEASRAISRAGKAPSFSELMLVPVIDDDNGTVFGDAKAWASAERCISEAIGRWLAGQGRHTIFRRVVPYEWIAGWEPSIFRQHVMATAVAIPQASVEFEPAMTQAPEGAPRLGFITFTVTRSGGWLQMRTPNTLRDARFRDVVGHALAHGASDCAAEVLPPEQMSAALLDGLCLWLMKIHAIWGVQSWHMHPVATKTDGVQIAIELGGGKTVQVETRRHQLGPAGMTCISEFLARVSPQGATGHLH